MSGTGHSQATLMYAYMRAWDTEPDEELRQAELDLSQFADAHGCLLGGIFQEHQPGSFREFRDLVGELRKTGARHLAVPTCDHLSANRILRDRMIDTLQSQASAQVWVLARCDPRKRR